MREHNGTATQTLRHWLTGRTESERATLARLWALPDVDIRNPGTLADAMLCPANVARLLQSLTQRERGALVRIQEHGGSIPAAVVEREFGGVRDHTKYLNPRAYLLALEQPPSPTERLYTLALIQVVGEGAQQFYTIPPDLLGLLPPVPPRSRMLELRPQAAPETIIAGEAHDVERALLTLLSLAHDGELEITPAGGLNKASLVRLARQWNKQADLQGITREDQWPYVQFLRRLAQSTGLIRVSADARLRPTREALEWMRLSASDRAGRLLEGWVISDWDELVSVVGLRLHTAFSRDLPAAKRELVQLLAQLPPGDWFELDSLAAAIKATHPDFARPTGRYDTWNMVNHLGQPLDGFEHWDEVEGQQLRAIVGGTLRWLGLTDVGMRGEKPEVFRINALGAVVLGHTCTFAAPPAEPLVIQPNFEVVVPIYATLEGRFQLSRIAERVGGEQVEVFKLTKRSVQAALEQGIAVEDMLRFLQAQSLRDLPQNVVATLREWAGQHGQVGLRRAVLLEVAEPALAEQLKRDKRVRLPQVERLTDTAWLVREGDAPALAERLRKAGYGLTGDVDNTHKPLRDHDLTVLFAALTFYEQACDTLGIESDVSAAMLQRLARLLPEKQLNRAYQASSHALQRLEDRLDSHERP